MLLKPHHLFDVFIKPRCVWSELYDMKDDPAFGYHIIGVILIGSLLPPLCAFIGTTITGWRVGFGEPVWLTMGSALPMAILSYFAIIFGILIMGFFIRWMSHTYNSSVSILQSMAFMAYAATPLFLAGLFALVPSLWLAMLGATLAVSHSVYLLYLGTPVFMDISEERGFLYATSILAVGLVMMVAMLAATVMLWSLGFGPVYFD